jgi:serine dehydrogenase proteinase
MSTPSAGNDEIQAAADEVAEDLGADILLFNAPMERPFDSRVIRLCRKRNRRKQVLLILVTEGGNADAAYRVARCLQLKYERVTLFVTGYCKSAGTLVALGAHDLVFTEHGELGPLDVQMSKKDSLWDMQSGLTVNAALTALQNKAYLAFEEFFLGTEDRSQGAITVKTAAEMAASLTVGLFAPLYSQIDPIHVGEAARAMQIADQYGTRLTQCSKNCAPDELQTLITHYPSHGFVIDRQEAEGIFENVREPSERELNLADVMGSAAIFPLAGEHRQIRFLSRELEPERKEAEDVQEKGVAPATSADHNGPPQEDRRAAAHRTSPQPRAGTA